MRERGAWKALRHRTCTISSATGVLPSRQNYCNSFFRALRTRLLSLRSVVPSRHKRYMNTNVPTSRAPLGRSFSTVVWLRLGIVQVNLASALALHKRFFFLHHTSTRLALGTKSGSFFLMLKASYQASMWGSAPFTRQRPAEWGSVLVSLRSISSRTLLAQRKE